MKDKLLKTLGIIFIIIMILGIGTIIIYKNHFEPKTKVTPISNEVTIDNKYLIKKFLPKNFNFSLKEVFVESNTNFSEEEITNLFIYAINEMPDIKEYITGLKVDIERENINIYIHAKYKNIPFEGKLTFTAYAENGKGIFHYKEGNIGFIDIKKEFIFNEATPTSVIDFDKENGDIILTFKAIKQLEVRNISTIENGINIVFRGTLKFWEWLN
ncbi:MAG: hypothetical protein ACRC2K_02595 [Clostridium sp.]